jgi:hypothetical protein
MWSMYAFWVILTQPLVSANQLRYVVSYDILQKHGKRLEEAITLSRQKVCIRHPSL